MEVRSSSDNNNSSEALHPVKQSRSYAAVQYRKCKEAIVKINTTDKYLYTHNNIQTVTLGEAKRARRSVYRDEAAHSGMEELSQTQRGSRWELYSDVSRA